MLGHMSKKANYGGAYLLFLPKYARAFCFFARAKSRFGGSKSKKQILLPPKEQKSKNAYGGSKKQIKQKSRICYFAILLFSLFCSKIAKKQKANAFLFEYAILLFCYLAYFAIREQKSKKANAFLFKYDILLFSSSITKELLRNIRPPLGFPKKIQRNSFQL